MELVRGIVRRLTGMGVEDSPPKRLRLSHRVSRPTEKVDAVFIEAIGLYDDLDKELNKFAMKVGKLYGRHFPELANIVSDNILYAKAVKLMGNRTNAATLDFTGVLPQEIGTHLKAAAIISVGSELNELEFNNIKGLCDQVLCLSESRDQLYDDLKISMNTIAPNLTDLVGELVGARLIAHSGGLLNLVNQPGSKIQILGKPLFRGRKKNGATPNCGLIWDASLIGKASPRNKLNMARSLAAKIALAVRCDAFRDTQDDTLVLENRAKLEERLRSLEARGLVHSAKSHSSSVNAVAMDKRKIGKQKSERNEVEKEDKA
ncbi:hypothetical protein MKW92_022194 [Papaver armeniacum]|nr:hypothetical protein MKW92_022194 [Papaver armeniacum]